jgi:hypothetical protein
MGSGSAGVSMYSDRSDVSVYAGQLNDLKNPWGV